ncbi:MAG: uroporphyrinogen decarboxylase family protein [Thermoproteota archaeon]
MTKMRTTLSSRERLLQAINHREPDHIPLYLKWWERPYLSDKSQAWRNQFERVERVLGLGLDDTVGFDVPRPMSREVKVKVRKDKLVGEPWPILTKEYITPKGTLKQVVRQTADWPHGDDIPIFSDFLAPASRSIKYLVQDEDDLDPLSCIFRDLEREEISAFRNEAERVRKFAEEKQILVECGMWSEAGVESAIFGADALPWLCGFENVMRKAYRDPDFIERLLDIVHEWDMRYLDALIDLGFVDVVVHRGWYENADFWSPNLYKKFLEPRIRRLIEKTHRSGAKFCYIMSMKQMPLLSTMKEMGVDILYGIDPVQGGTDLVLTKKMVGDNICLWGGVNSAVTLNSGTPKEIRKATIDCIKILAPGGGFILSSIDQIFEDTPWKNVQIMIDAWREMGNYYVS